MFGNGTRVWLLAGFLLATPVLARGEGEKKEATRTGTGGPEGAPDLARVKDRIISLTNQFRVQEKKRELKVNRDLAQAAQAFADFMAKTDEYGHEADGKTPAERAAAAGYKYCIVAENIAYVFRSDGFTTEELVKEFVEGWKKSPPHRKNMLDPDLMGIGVGVARSAKSGKYYAVQDFGRPKSEEIAFKITNKSDRTVKYTLEGKDFSVKPRYTVTHQMCRPSDLTLRLPDKESDSVERKKTLQPKNDSHFTIRKGEDGTYQVEKE